MLRRNALLTPALARQRVDAMPQPSARSPAATPPTPWDDYEWPEWLRRYLDPRAPMKSGVTPFRSRPEGGPR